MEDKTGNVNGDTLEKLPVTRLRSNAVGSRAEAREIAASRIAKLKADIKIAKALTKKDPENSEFNTEVKKLFQSIYPEEDKATICNACLKDCIEEAFIELKEFSESYPGTRNASTNKQNTLVRLKKKMLEKCNNKICAKVCKGVDVILQLSEEVIDQIEKIKKNSSKRKKLKKNPKKVGGRMKAKGMKAKGREEKRRNKYQLKF